jgi:hypothetical protein
MNRETVLTMRSSSLRLTCTLPVAPRGTVVFPLDEVTTGRAGVSGWEDEGGVDNGASVGGTTEDADLRPTGVM